MIRNLFYAAFAATALTICMTSCGGKDDVNVVEPEPEPEVASTTANFKLETATNSSFNSLCGISVSYKVTDANGNVQADVKTVSDALTFSKVVCPCVIDITYSFIPNEGAIVDSQEYSTQFGPLMEVSTSNATTKSYGSVVYADHNGYGMKTLLSLIAASEYQITFTVSKDGDITTNNNGDYDFSSLNESIIDYGGTDEGKGDKSAESRLWK